MVGAQNTLKVLHGASSATLCRTLRSVPLRAPQRRLVRSRHLRGAARGARAAGAALGPGRGPARAAAGAVVASA